MDSDQPNNSYRGIKNIRAKIKNSYVSSDSSFEKEDRLLKFESKNSVNSHKKTCNQNSENEISFNITPEEDELISNFNQNNSSFERNKNLVDEVSNSPVLDTESLKIHKEAKELIARTKNVMKNLGNMYIKTESDHYHQEEKPFDPGSLPKSEGNKMKTNYNISSSTNMNTLNEKLLEKIKMIKNYEKEIKEKTITIDKLQSKLDKQYEEIKKLQEKLNTDKGLNFKAEITILTRKLKEKEDEINAKTKLFDSIIDEYKNKIENLLFLNETTTNKLKNLESKLKNDKFKEEYGEIYNQKNSLEIQMKNLKENFESEIKEKKNLEKKNEKLLQNIDNLLSNIKNFYMDQKKLNNIVVSLKQKVNLFYELDLSNGKNEAGSSQD